MDDLLTKSALAPHVGSRFDVAGVDGLVLELVEVEDLPGAPGRDDSFSLTFRWPQQGYLPQAIYPLRHGALGTIEMFLVPIRQDAEGLYLEALFNRAGRV